MSGKLKALILVGGFGTRLRPLTFTLPKPLVEFGNKPMMEHQIEALANVGVKEIILAVSYLPREMEGACKHFESKYNIKVTMSVENEPMGTAGPLALAKSMLEDAELFFVLNSDVICDFPFAQMIEFHRAHGKEGTIVGTRVAEPSRYGVIVSDPDGRIERFVEKPQTFVGNNINAGLYLFKPSILKRIPMKPTSIEKEIFPAMAVDQELYMAQLEGFWMDVGQPNDFIGGTALYLASLRTKAPQTLASGSHIQGNVLIDPTATIHPDSVIGPNVSIGPGAVVESGARIRNSVLLARSRIGAHALVANSIIGWASSVGRWSRVDQVTVLGEDVHVAPEIYVNAALVLPHKTIAANVPTGGIFM